MIGIIQYFSPDLACEPLVYPVYPWVEKFPFVYTYDPDTQQHINNPNLYQFYNNPDYDGVCLNVVLTGWRNSWEGPGGGVYGIYTNLMKDPSGNINVDGGVLYPMDEYSTEPIYDSWVYSRAFEVSHPVVFARYDAVGGSNDGTINIPAGQHKYEGVASISSWARSFIQARSMGHPVQFEMYYSLNMNRSNPLRGYNNYSFFGDEFQEFPWVTTKPEGHVITYYAGIFKATANLEAPLDSDFVYGVKYDGDENGGTAKIFENGIVRLQASSNTKVTEAYAQLNTAAEEYISLFKTGKMFSDYLGLNLSTNNFQFIPEYDSFFIENAQIRDEPLSFEGVIDTYQVKWAWRVHSNTGMGENTWDWQNPIYMQAPMMYTHPHDILPCPPLTEQPYYVAPPPTGQIYEIYDAFISTSGPLLGSLVNSDSESSSHVTEEGYSWNVGFWQYFGDVVYPTGLTITPNGTIVHQTPDTLPDSDPNSYVNGQYLDAWCLHEMSTFNYFVELVIKCPPKPLPPDDFNNWYASVTIYGRIQTAPNANYGADDTKFITCELGMNDDVNNLQLPFGSGVNWQDTSEIYPPGVIVPYVEGYRLFRVEFEDQTCRLYVDGVLYHTVTSLDETHTNNGYVGFGMSRRQLYPAAVEVVEFRAGAL